MEAKLLRFDWCQGEMCTAEYGDYVNHDEAVAVIEKLEAKIEELEGECNSLSDQCSELGEQKNDLKEQIAEWKAL